jgi:hypothetical protein
MYEGRETESCVFVYTTEITIRSKHVHVVALHFLKRLC